MTRAGDIINQHNGLRTEYFEDDLTVLYPVRTGRDIDDRPYTEWRAETYRGRLQQSLEPQEDTNEFGEQVIVSVEFIVERDAPLKSPPADAAIDEYEEPPRIRTDGTEYEMVHARDAKTGRWVVSATRINNPLSDTVIA